MHTTAADSLRVAVRASRERRNDGVRQLFTLKFRISFVVRLQPHFSVAFCSHDCTPQYRTSLLRCGTIEKGSIVRSRPLAVKVSLRSIILPLFERTVKETVQL